VANGLVELAQPDKAKIDLLRSDGSSYGPPGTLDFSDMAVNAATGTVELRGLVPNPEHNLLPGMFVNVRVTVGELKHAWLVPQAAVQRDAKGAYVYVLGSDGKIAQKYIDTYTTQGADWIAYGGLADGDQVVTTGLMKVRPGAPAKVAAPQQSAQLQAKPEPQKH
jgi:membrane fusion protein (multidrug efflux system)